MSYLPFPTSANGTGTTGEPSAVILKLSASATLTKNRIITITGDDSNCTLNLTSTGINNTAIGATTPSTGAFTGLAVGDTHTPSYTISVTKAGASFRLFDSGASGASIGMESKSSGIAGRAGIYSSGQIYLNAEATDIGRLTSTGLNAMAIGATTPSTGVFTSLVASISGNPAQFTNSAAAAANNEVLRLRWTTSTTAGHSGDLNFTNTSNTVVGAIRNVIVAGGGSTKLVLATYNGSMNDRVFIDGAGLVQMNGYGAGTATFDASGNITSVSDERAKRNIRPFKAGLTAVLGLRTILHGYTKESGLDQTRDDYAGFSAQNVRKFIAEAVAVGPSGMLSLSDRPIIAALVNAVQEQQAVIIDLKEQLRVLRV